MNKVWIISPHRGATPDDVQRNAQYLVACIKDSFTRGEAPLAFHGEGVGLYTRRGVLDDDDPERRQRGMDAARKWTFGTDIAAVYTQSDASRGMLSDIEYAKSEHIEVEYRRLTDDWDTHSGGVEHSPGCFAALTALAERERDTMTLCEIVGVDAEEHLERRVRALVEAREKWQGVLTAIYNIVRQPLSTFEMVEQIKMLLK